MNAARMPGEGPAGRRRKVKTAQDMHRRYEVDYTFAVEKETRELKDELQLDLPTLFGAGGMFMEPSSATYRVTVIVPADTPEDAARAVTAKLGKYGDDYNVQVRAEDWMSAPPDETGGWNPNDFNLLDVDFPSTRLGEASSEK